MSGPYPLVSLGIQFNRRSNSNLVLDPRISYNILKEDYANDPSLDVYLESSKQLLHTHYLDHYAPRPNETSTTVTPSLHSTSSSGSIGQHSPQKSFTARYKKSASTAATNELDRYFQYPQEDFDHCDPISWWYKRREDMPNLYRLARDIMTIPV